MRTSTTTDRKPKDREIRPPFPKKKLRRPGLEKNLNPNPRYEAPEYRPAAKLQGRVALVTGGDSGIGRAIAYLFAREGADVAIVHLRAERADALETKAAIERAGRRALLIAGDVKDPAFCAKAVAQTVREFGKLDVLVNNAGHQLHHESLLEITPAAWDKTFRTNIYGYFYMARAAIPHLRPGSSIINTGSITGLEGSKELVDYAATKGAIHAFTKSLAQNLIEKGIRVNCVAPGPVWTPLNPADAAPSDIAFFGADTPYKRPAQPEEVAPAYVFFASDADSGFITGNVLPVLGGSTVAG